MEKKRITFSVLLQYSFIFLFITFLFVGGPNLKDTRSFTKLWDLGHIILFALIFFRLTKDSKWLSSKRIAHQIILILIFTLLFGFLIEGIQLLIGRTSDFSDVWRSVVGGLFAVVFSKKLIKSKNKLSFVYQGVVLILVAFEFWPFIKTVVDEVQTELNFPVIADFEDPFELGKWHGRSHMSISKEYVAHGEQSLKVELLTTKYSGISVNYFPKNWQDYSKIRFNIFYPYSDSLNLTCRMHDTMHNNKYSDRFNKRFFVRSGWNDIAIDLKDVISAPEDREIDISSMKNFTIFAVKLKDKRIIYFDYLRLE